MVQGEMVQGEMVQGEMVQGEMVIKRKCPFRNGVHPLAVTRIMLTNTAGPGDYYPRVRLAACVDSHCRAHPRGTGFSFTLSLSLSLYGGENPQ